MLTRSTIRAIRRGDWKICMLRDYYAPGGTVPLHRKGEIEVLEPWIAKAFIASGIAERISWKKAELSQVRPKPDAPKSPTRKVSAVKTRASHLAPDQMEGLKSLYMGAYSIRVAAQRCRVTKRTASKFYHRFRATLGPVTCPCGQPATHLGWCKWRLGQSEARQRYLSHRTDEASARESK